ncbi:MAG: CRTAC1 family protein, partial [Pyrinomonadaceae bacterium]|nr:CRTAC1 family protein [Pyrinomonadaceae bacterium]
FTDITFQVGLGEPTIPFLGWGTSFVDYNNDGWKDIIVANGHVYPTVDKYQWGTSFAQQMLLFQNVARTRGGKEERVFERIGAAPGSALAMSIPARGLAVGDFDNDGRLDAILNNIDSKPTLIRNVTKSPGHWLMLRLNGDVAKKTPKDATGAIAYLTTGKLRLRLDAISGAGYGSQNDSRLHFGLGAATKIDKLEIKWPSGTLETFDVSAVDQILTLNEGKGTAK